MKRVLVTPLDWGLGHATRCIPIIKKLIERNCEVLIAGNGDSLQLLKAEFPQLRHFVLPGYDPRYPVNGSMVLAMLIQVPKFLSTIRSEHNAIEKLISQQKVDLIISDNRYGCWSSKIISVLITHQSNILMPKRFGWLQELVRKMNIRHMEKFSTCWIPDVADKRNLAGDLISFGKIRPSLNVNYIGPLSRFGSPNKHGSYSEAVSSGKRYDVTAIFSGPEPQRTLIENIVIPQLKISGLKYFVVRGLFSSTNTQVIRNEVDFLTANDLEQVIESSEIIIARSGYSTVMDLATLGKKAIFIPTPGQTEQEYLAQRLMDKGIAFFMAQDVFDLSNALENTKKFSGFQVMRNSNEHLLDNALDEVLDLLKSN